MKSILTSLTVFGSLIVGGALSDGRAPGAVTLLSSAFAAGLAGWTLRQYDRSFRPLNRGQRVLLPLGADRSRPMPRSQSLAA